MTGEPEIFASAASARDLVAAMAENPPALLTRSPTPAPHFQARSRLGSRLNWPFTEPGEISYGSILEIAVLPVPIENLAKYQVSAEIVLSCSALRDLIFSMRFSRPLIWLIDNSSNRDARLNPSKHFVPSLPRQHPFSGVARIYFGHIANPQNEPMRLSEESIQHNAARRRPGAFISVIAWRRTARQSARSGIGSIIAAPHRANGSRSNVRDLAVRPA